nr:ribonuclease H-like domain-containing protein [Tanacetum cinerariifolium]
MYNVNLKNVVPSGDLTCLFAKATLDESNLWHRRLGHINFKTMNKLVKGNLVRGLPSKIFENNHTCVACKKGKQHKASCKSKHVSSISQPLQRVLVTKPHNKTPYELLLGRSPNIGFMRPFGCLVTILNTLDPLRKFDGQDDEGFLVGYSVNSKAFRVFNSRTRIVQETLHINFLENKSNVAGIRPKWLFDNDTLTMSMNYQPVVAGNQPNNHACIKENLDAGKVRKETVSAQQYVLLPLWSTGSQDPHNIADDIVDAAFDVKENENDVHVSANGSGKSDNKKHDKKAKRDDKGKSHVDSPTGVRVLIAEFKEFSFNSTNKVNAVSAPVNADEPNSTNSTNSFNTASPSVNAVSPNFRIARKSLFVDHSKYPDDPDKSELKDIVYLDDKEDVGAEADLPNLETNIPLLKQGDDKDGKKQGGLHQINDEDFYTYLPKGKRAIGSKWVFRNKNDERGIVIRNKTRLVARGHTQEEGIEYDEVFAHVAKVEAIRLFLAYASFMGFMVYQMDVKGAFLYRTIKEEVYICQPLRFEDPDYPDKVYKVVKALYGLHQATRAWSETLANYLLKNDVKSASTPIETEKDLLKDPNGEDVDVHIYRHFITVVSYELMLFGLMKVVAINLMLLGHKLMLLRATDTFKKVNDVVQLHALIDGKKVVVSEDILRRNLHLDDADGVECLLNEEIFEELARMGYEKPHLKLTFYKAFFSTQWKFLIHTLVESLTFPNIYLSMVRNVDSPSKFLMYPRFLQVVMDNQVDDMTSYDTRYTSYALTHKVFANMQRVRKEEEVEMPITSAPPSPTNAPSPPPQDPTPTPHATPPQDQPFIPPASPPPEQPTTSSESSMSLLTTLMETCATLSQKVAELEQDKHTQSLKILQLKIGRMHPNRGNIEAIDADERITLVDMETQEEEVAMDVKPQGRINQEEVNAASKGVNVAEPTVFDDEDTLFKPNKDVEEPKKKRVADETLLQESFKKLKAAEVSGSESTQETPSNDPKEMSEKDVQNMLEIVPAVGGITEAYQSFKDMLKGLDREDLVALWNLVKEKFSSVVPSQNKEKALWVELKIEEDNEMARDLVMKIFIEANKLKSRRRGIMVRNTSTIQDTNRWCWKFRNNKQDSSIPIRFQFHKEVEKIASSFYITNFPDYVDAKRLWVECQSYERIMDAFIANKRSKSGKRFGFVRFLGVKNEEQLARSLASIWIGSYHIFAFVARFNRQEKIEVFSKNNRNKKTNSIPSQKADHVGSSQNKKSYASSLNGDRDSKVEKQVTAVKGNTLSNVPLTPSSITPALVLDDSCARNEGETMDIEENLVSSFARKRLCIKTKQADNILEKFKVIFKGKVYMARAKELFTWTPIFLDHKESEYISDNESLHGAKNKSVGSQHGEDDLVD